MHCSAAGEFGYTSNHMGYREYNSHKSRHKRSYSTSRQYQPGLAEMFGEYLGDLLLAFGRWIGQALGRVLGQGAQSPSSQDDNSNLTNRHPLPLRDTPLATQPRAANYRNLPYRKVQGLITPGEHGILVFPPRRR
jgi:hypothetical protein